MKCSEYKKSLKNGFSSLEFLIVLLLIAALIVGGSVFVKYAGKVVVQEENLYKEKACFDEYFSNVMELIKNDKTNEADSRFDPVWKLDKTEENGIRINIRSLSGCLDLNFLDNEFINQSNILALLQNPETGNSDKALAIPETLEYSYKSLGEEIEEEDFNKYFTFYSFADINIAERAKLKMLIESLTDSYTAENINSKLKILTDNKQLIQNDIDLRMLLGIDYNRLFPYVNVDPVLNINFIPANLLKILLSYSKFNLHGISEKLEEIISLREKRELQTEDICNILEITKSDELYYYLGCKTWFWEIIISGKKQGCRYIVGRGRNAVSAQEPEYFLVEKQYFESKK